MSTSIRRRQLTIPQPCAESWEAMTPTQRGRHCAACQQVVVDFTRHTDAELLAYLVGAKVTSCGRFRADQLNRPLHPTAPASRWRVWLASALALGGVLSAGRAAGQSRSHYAGPLPEVVGPAAGAAPTVPAPARPTAPVAATPASPGEPMLLHGVVLEAATGQPLPGVAVLVKGTETGTSTDAEGRFSLTATSPADSLRLSVQFVGFVTQEVTVTHSQPPLTIQLHADSKGLGEVIMVGAYESRRPWPWHPGALYHWTRYQVSRLLNR